MNNIDLVETYGADAVGAALQKLEQDPEFRAEAKADLNAAVLKHFGVALPVPMRLIEDDQGFRAEVADAGDGRELSDHELDLVAGGGRSTGSGKDDGVMDFSKSRASRGRIG
ncbi:hypothetical protein SAMN02982917_1888 [Azospirillum oryzae]|uniref:NHLP leader peptide domain-containing protein n=1 Tax=Azospirillum oryzae TaxID=286727 RepID=A0A1X7ENQ3_9PROT|nr:hypothetical protein [Azospirillum oryzae]SMF36795.1 hypothetical protein SAMN02982917_1888 [Azospirillum oryzae]